VRGHYRILLGMAAGVGKTYRMLQEGRQAQVEGRDVVIGYLEPHDRPDTIAVADGLEQVPPHRAEQGAVVINEMDLDAVIARAPELALIDELAHTNGPGMRHAKRYEDIEEVLDAGIDVISTVNIQHLESLNDTVLELTRVRVRETFPDRILDEADEVVLVDLSPEALQARISAGKVYRTDRIDAALTNFFRTENLNALRELALREVAEDVAERGDVGIADPLTRPAVSERVLVLATPEPRSQRVVRRAWRSASRLGAELDVLWVRKPGQRLDDQETASLAALRRLVTILGGHYIEEQSAHLVETIKRVTAERGTTYVILGTPDERRRTEILRGSLVSALVRELRGIDIRVVANRADREQQT
jgi:two-component system, OmpR family, sensor histidine kinase KdpD